MSSLTMSLSLIAIAWLLIIAAYVTGKKNKPQTEEREETKPGIRKMFVIINYCLVINLGFQCGRGYQIYQYGKEKEAWLEKQLREDASSNASTIRTNQTSN